MENEPSKTTDGETTSLETVLSSKRSPRRRALQVVSLLALLAVDAKAHQLVPAIPIAPPAEVAEAMGNARL